MTPPSGMGATEDASPAESRSASETRREVSDAYQGAMPQLLWQTDGSGNWTGVSPDWSTYTGQPAERALAQGWQDMVHPADRERISHAWGGFVTSTEINLTCRIWNEQKKSYHHFLGRATATLDGLAQVKSWFGVLTDIEYLHQLDMRHRATTSELRHRVRNSLATIRSIARRSAETARGIDDYLVSFDGRLDAFARAQGIAARSRSGSAPFDLEHLIAEELFASGVEDSGRFSLRGPSILLQVRVIEMFALMFHELVKNALKYGALATDDGRLDVEWRFRPGGEKVVLEWRETVFSGHANTRPMRRGFGLDLLQNVLRYELKAETELDFSSAGFRLLLVFPADPNVSP